MEQLSADLKQATDTLMKYARGARRCGKEFDSPEETEFADKIDRLVYQILYRGESYLAAADAKVLYRAPNSAMTFFEPGSCPDVA